MFTSILTTTTGNLTIVNAMLCTLVSLALGIGIALLYKVQGQCSKNFVITLALLPTIVQVVIMMVSGNLGASVAVLGTFSLVRFRSVPGSSKEICAVFFAMAVGLATGMGYLTFAALMAVVVGGAMLLLSKTRFGETKTREKALKIVLPENLDYTGLFDDLFAQYTAKAELERVKTTNLGSLYELHYRVVLRGGISEKALIDDIRCRNGNLTVSLGWPQLEREEL